MKKIINLFLLALLAGACTEKMDIELDESYTRLVVEADLTDEARAHKVILTTTAPYFSNAPVPVVREAHVVLGYENDSLLLTETQPGIYTTPDTFAGQPGTLYTLNIRLKAPIGGKTLYTASSMMNDVIDADSIGIRYRETVRSGFWEVMCYAAEPSGPDYYLFKTYQNGVLLSDSLINWISYDDRLIDGNYILGLGTGFISKRRGETLNPGDTVTLEISGIEKWFHEYVNFMRRELFPQTPLFSATPTNVKGNISGGALGYFTARSVTYISTVYKGTGTDN